MVFKQPKLVATIVGEAGFEKDRASSHDFSFWRNWIVATELQRTGDVVAVGRDFANLSNPHHAMKQSKFVNLKPINACMCQRG